MIVNPENVCGCGKPKAVVSRMCRDCYSDWQELITKPEQWSPYDVCPLCGGKKGKRSAMCRACKIAGQHANRKYRYRMSKRGHYIKVEDCPECGGEMTTGSRMCQSCFRKQLKESGRKYGYADSDG